MIQKILAFGIEKAYAFNAEPLQPKGDGDVSPVTSSAKLGDFVKGLGGDLLNTLTLIAGTAAVIFLIWYGIQYIMAGGSPDKAKAARAGIVNTVIGVIIIAAAYGIIRLAITVASTINSTF